MARIDSGTLYGTLNLLVLRSLSDGALHGLDIARSIETLSRDALRVEEGALYPALHRLERDGLLESRWGTSERGRRARFYTLTAQGRKALNREVQSWVRHARAVARVLDLAPDEVP